MNTPSVNLVDMKIAALLNKSSGSCDEKCEARISEILGQAGLIAKTAAVEGNDVGEALKDILDDKVDLLIVLGGDGTIRAAAESCADTTTKLIPLPGGTMNMLPRALYGEGSWDVILRRTLAAPTLFRVGGGEVEGNRFFCAGLFGSPSLWADAREAMRKNRWGVAFSKALRAYHQAFSRKLRYRFSGNNPRSATALAIICPLISARIQSDAKSLEIAALDPSDLADAFQLAWTAFFTDWRRDENVSSLRSDNVVISAGGRIPALLDGEKVLLSRTARVSFQDSCFVAVVPEDRGPTRA